MVYPVGKRDAGTGTRIPDQGADFTLPSIGTHAVWLRMLDTIAPHVEERRYTGGSTYPLEGRTLALFVLSIERRERRASPPEPAKGPPLLIPDEKHDPPKPN